MRRAIRIALIVLGAIAGVVFAVLLATLIALRTQWFQRYASAKLATAIEDSTGAKVSIGRLSVSILPLGAEATDIVLRGTEGRGEPPLLRARDVTVTANIRLLLQGKPGIESLVVDQPQLYVRLARDGTTNIPQPKTPQPPTNKSPLQTVIDLAIGHVALNNGLVQFADRKTPFNLRGDNLRAILVYHLTGPSYTGSISLDPVYVQGANGPAFPVNVRVPLEITGGRLSIDDATFDAFHSSLRLQAAVDDLNAPRLSASLSGRLNAAEIARAFQPSLEAQLRNMPMVEVALAGGLTGNRAQIANLRVVCGSSAVTGSGALDDLKNTNGKIRLEGRLAAGELGRLLKLSSKPQGTVVVAANATLAGAGNYVVEGRINGHDLAVSAGGTRLAGVEASSAIEIDPQTLRVKGLRVDALSGTLTAQGEIHRASQAFQFDAALQGFDLRRLARTYASPRFVWDGLLSGPVHAQGSLGPDPERRLLATARLSIAPGHRGIPLGGLIDASYDGPAGTLTFGNSRLSLPSTQLVVSGAMNRQLNIRLTSRNLDDILPALAMAASNPPQQMPVKLAHGLATFDGAVAGTLSDPHVNGHVLVTNFVVQGRRFDRVSADANAAKNGAGVSNLLLKSGRVELQASASVGLENWKPEDRDPVTASASIESSDVGPVLALAGYAGVPVTGALKASAQASNTFGDPHVNAQAALTGGNLRDEPYQRLQAVLSYSGTRLQLHSAQVVLPAGQIDADGVFDHPPGDLKNGRVQFHLASSPILLDRLQTVRKRKPDIGGTIEIGADGAGMLQSSPGQPTFVPQNVMGRLRAHAVESGSPLADVDATATMDGQEVVFNLNSNVAGSNIRGGGTVELAGDYPLNAKATFTPVQLAALQRLLTAPEASKAGSVDGSVEGDLTASGPLLTPQNLKATLNLSKLEMTAAVAAPGKQQTLLVRNEAPVVVNLDHQAVVVQSARFTGPSMRLNIGGTLNLASMETDAHADGDMGLAAIQTLDPDITAGGDILLQAAVKGRLAQPRIDGRLQLRNASLNAIDVSNGLTNANGEVVFSGTQAQIRNFSGQSGGGQITLGGVVRYGGPVLDFRLNAAAHHVRVRPSNSMSAQFNAKLDLAGTTERSLVSGNVTVLDVAMYSHSDVGDLLSQTSSPPSAPAAEGGLLSNMRLDVRIDTAPGVQFESELTQGLQADAHLRLRGSPNRPGLIGRVTADEGTLVFFGSKYTVTEGVVKFSNPTRIEPVVDLGLETKSNGVTVDLAVKGPPDHLQLTYTSDPPMEFSDMVSLLATGRASSTDPVLAAQQPPQPQQNFEQTGASAVLDQGLAAPVSGQLQRLFGVTSLKIDPQIVGPENIPQAQLTLAQQITQNLSFTYIQDLTSSNPEVIRIEWAINPVWSAVATREPDGEFGVDLYYKVQFH
jgi:translocation and assembly module TamB